MSGRRINPADANAPASTWTPRLGDLARDSTTERVGVVVDVPGEGVYSYHLRPPGGGEEWTAPRDGSTLHPTDDRPPRRTAGQKCRRNELLNASSGWEGAPSATASEGGPQLDAGAR
ncbi:hypothetical protein GCM10010442_13860 [Kitasatospora kifunensis]